VAARVPQLLIDFILSLIKQESGGQPGRIARRSTKFARELPSKEGGTVKAKQALGLMQTIPLVVDNYNKSNPTLYYEDMTGATAAAAQKQVQVGLWAFERNRKAIEALTGRKLIDKKRLNLDLLKLVLVAYNWGIGRTKTKLKALKKDGLAPTFKNLSITWPTLGEPANRPLFYANRIVKRALFPGSPGDGQAKPIDTSVSNWFLAGLGAVLIWFLMKGYR
jgi:hypothetical protein